MRGGERRQAGRAPAGQDRDRLDGAALDLRHGERRIEAQIVDPLAHQVLHGGRAAPIGNMRRADPDRRVEQRAGDMRGRAGAARAELYRGLVRARMGHESRQIVRRKVRSRDQHQRRLGDQRDRREITRRVIERMLVERLVLGVRPDIAEHDLIAVGRRLGDAGGAGHAAGAAHILDHHLLAQEFAQTRRQDAPDRVHRPARREGHHHGDRRGRPIGRRSLRRGGQGGREGRQHGKRPDQRHDGSCQPGAAPARRRKTFPPHWPHPASFSAAMVAGVPSSPSTVSAPQAAHT